MTYETIMAGFGGQGLLFSGKVLAHAALIENKELSWLPSYGPEMRGGTCNCSVIVSDEPVGSPIIAHPNVLMVMNEPSLDKFEDTVAPGGTIFVDSSLIGQVTQTSPYGRDPKTQGMPIRICELLASLDAPAYLERVAVNSVALRETISARKANLLDLNLKAVAAGRAFIRG